MFKIERKSRIVKKYYWDCGACGNGHWHRAEESAAACLYNRENPVGERKDLSERNSNIVLGWLKEQNASKIAIQYKLSSTTVGDILKEYFKYVVKFLKRGELPAQPAGRYKIILTSQSALEIYKTKRFIDYFNNHLIYSAESTNYRKTGKFDLPENFELTPIPKFEENLWNSLPELNI